MSILSAQFGIAKETTYATPVTVSRFFEFSTESIKQEFGRVESKGIRAGALTMRADRFQPYPKGPAGSVEFDVPTKGFGVWLEHLLGGTVTTSAVVDSNYTHTAQIGSLYGKGLTAQVGRPLNPSGTVQPFTLSGGKVTGWNLSMEKEGLLTCGIDLDFATGTTATGLATASYPANFTNFSWVGANISIGGTNVCLNKFSVKVENAQDTEKYMLCGTSTKHEPTDNGLRMVSWEAEAEFADLVQYNRVASATRAGALAPIVATFDGPEIHAGATLPRLTVTMPAARFDGEVPTVGGTDSLLMSLSGVALDDGTATTALQVAYRTTDATP